VSAATPDSKHTDPARPGRDEIPPPPAGPYAAQQVPAAAGERHLPAWTTAPFGSPLQDIVAVVGDSLRDILGPPDGMAAFHASLGDLPKPFMPSPLGAAVGKLHGVLRAHPDLAPLLGPPPLAAAVAACAACTAGLSRGPSQPWPRTPAPELLALRPTPGWGPTSSSLPALPAILVAAVDYAGVLGRVPVSTLPGKMIRALMTADGPVGERPADDVKREVYKKGEAPHVSLAAVRQTRREANRLLDALSCGSLQIVTSGKGQYVQVVARPVTVPAPAAAPYSGPPMREVA